MKTFLTFTFLFFTNLICGASFSDYRIQKIERSRLLFLQTVETTDENEVASTTISVTFVTQEKCRVTCGNHELKQESRFILHHVDFLLEQDACGNTNVIAIIDDAKPMAGTEEAVDHYTTT